MKLITAQVLNAFEKYNVGSIPDDDSLVVVKYFDPAGAGTWWITNISEIRITKDGEMDTISPIDHPKIASELASRIAEGWSMDDIIFYCYAVITDYEWGTISLKELTKFRGKRFGQTIERDLHIANDVTISDIKKQRGVN